MSRREVELLAKVLCVTPTASARVERGPPGPGWWLVGCIEGDTALPRTSGCRTAAEAIENALAWLAVEVDREVAGDRCGSGNECGRLGCQECQK